MDSTIEDNSPFGINLVDTLSSILIVGVVEVTSNDIFGTGSLEMESGASLDTSDCAIYIGDMSGPGTIQIDAGTEVTIDGNSSVDLSDPSDPFNSSMVHVIVLQSGKVFGAT